MFGFFQASTLRKHAGIISLSAASLIAVYRYLQPHTEAGHTQGMREDDPALKQSLDKLISQLPSTQSLFILTLFIKDIQGGLEDTAASMNTSGNPAANPEGYFENLEYICNQLAEVKGMPKFS